MQLYVALGAAMSTGGVTGRVCIVTGTSSAASIGRAATGAATGAAPAGVSARGAAAAASGAAGARAPARRAPGPVGPAVTSARRLRARVVLAPAGQQAHAGDQ